LSRETKKKLRILRPYYIRIHERGHRLKTKEGLKVYIKEDLKLGTLLGALGR